MTEKADAAGIREIMRSLAKVSWLGSARAHWPHSLFRVDDVSSAVSILEGGKIYSRGKALEKGLLSHDSASPSVIEHSPDWCKSCARLYFRPKTPTEYRSEGFRPKTMLELGAHRPMPIAFVFDSSALLSQKDTKFTDGNAAKYGCQVGDDLAFFSSIPFDRVYHDGPIPAAHKEDIVFRRCAEVLVPNELPLTHLRGVYCRSQAEYETLLSLLSDGVRKKYATKVGVTANLHYRQWTFVETAALAADRVSIQFNSSTKTPGPFNARATISGFDGSMRGEWMNPNYQAVGNLVLGLKRLKLNRYIVDLHLDGLLAYRNAYVGDESLV
jgi:hypothetical protein